MRQQATHILTNSILKERKHATHTQTDAQGTVICPLGVVCFIPLSRTESPCTGFPPAGREVPAWWLPLPIP